MLKLKILSPHRKIFEGRVKSITLPTQEGEITVLPKHAPLFTLLKEGILILKKESGGEDYYAVGGGYFETDGKEATVLVSRAFGQDEMDENLIKQAIESSQKILEKSKDLSERKQAEALLRRSQIDLRLLRRLRRRRAS